MTDPIPSPRLPTSAARARSARPGTRAPLAARRGAAPLAGYGDIARARWVALGGLSAMVAAVAIIVATAGGSSTRLAPVAAARAAAHPRYWIVRPGQSLSSIASRERIGLSEVERLNPHLVAGNLASGQRVRLPG